jgi:hypothetical protein
MTKLLSLMKDKNSEKGSVAPYLLGWFLGVPSSVLFLIFVLRGCH